MVLCLGSINAYSVDSALARANPRPRAGWPTGYVTKTKGHGNAARAGGLLLDKFVGADFVQQAVFCTEIAPRQHEV